MSREEQEQVFRDTDRLAEKIFLMQLQVFLDRVPEDLNPDTFIENLHAKGHIDSMLYLAEEIAYDCVLCLKEAKKCRE